MTKSTTRLKRPNNLSPEATIQWLIDNRISVTDAGCWEISDSQRPYTSVSGSPVLTYRLFYSVLVASIPDGLFVLHICDNGRCCNPAHLTVGSQAENMAHVSARCRNNQKLTPKQVREIRRRYKAGGITQAELGRAYGVSKTAIGYIVRGEQWPYAGGPTKVIEHFRGENSWNAVLNDAAVREIRASYATGTVSQYDLANRFGVSRSAVARIVQGRGWTHVD